MDFILALVELFRWMLRLRRYEGISIENRRFRSNRVSSAENFREKGSTPPTIPLVRKLAWPDLSCGIKMWAQVSSVLSQSSRSTDRQTDRQTERPCNAVRCIKCSRTVKTANTSVFVNVSVGAIIIASQRTNLTTRDTPASRQVGGAIASLSKVVPADVNRRDKSYESAP